MDENPYTPPREGAPPSKPKPPLADRIADGIGFVFIVGLIAFALVVVAVGVTIRVLIMMS